MKSTLLSRSSNSGAGKQFVSTDRLCAVCLHLHPYPACSLSPYIYKKADFHTSTINLLRALSLSFKSKCRYKGMLRIIFREGVMQNSTELVCQNTSFLLGYVITFAASATNHS